MLNTTDMKKFAVQKMYEGCNCCEAILWSYLSVNETSGYQDELFKIGTVFGGGIGTSREEVCGALSGILMVLSIQQGRKNCETLNDELMEQGRKLRSAFIERIGPTKCIALRQELENRYGIIDCKSVVQDCIELLDLVEIKT